ncbi:MAG: hypothetical protein ACK546_00080 [bacterium]|jgi:hypothetical protein
MSFFPHDIEIANLESPLDILSEAKLEWDSEGQGIISLLVDEGQSTSKDGTTFALIHVFVVHIPSQRVAGLLTVFHVSGKPYPARIKPERHDVPDFLRKERAVPPRPTDLSKQHVLSSFASMAPAHTVVEEWVCESPSEFRKQLAKALTQGSVKYTITSIVAASGNDVEYDTRTGLSVEESADGDTESNVD